MKMGQPLFVILILAIANVSFGDEVKLKWKYIDFRWIDDTQKQYEIKTGRYNPESCVPFDVDQSEDGRTFITMVRDKGVSASLMTVSDEMGPGGPLLEPYPTWHSYKDNDCEGIISVYRVAIKCNRLYALDCGKVGEQAVCPPRLLIFNLKNDQLIERIIIPANIANNKNGTGLLVTPVVHVENCENIDDATVFMADMHGYGLAIYNKKLGFSRIESDYMKPTDTNFMIEDQSFSLNDGILGLTVSDKKLYYSPLAGKNIYKMDIRNLQKYSKLNKNEIDELAGTLSGQTGPIASKECVIFFSNIPETSILCQDARKEFHSNNTEVILKNSELLQFASGLKVVGEELLFLTNRFQRVLTDTLNLNETNFRVISIDMEDIREKTNCFASCNNHRNKAGHYIL